MSTKLILTIEVDQDTKKTIEMQKLGVLAAFMQKNAGTLPGSK